ncbi:hypothetical protein PN462_07185 [Spirulina sp. CS-785/01]|uniref:hypothetical protein n=1 Tax=Spirulina sp. CS-785/01 TaxID=3021716 RepID=UPI00232F088A|nr:hypothetical protein [Spirulina sp. CS-785/01]MDB9312879.1 hypothetical protein [Spirulina sp. CS-785/01]
MKTKFSSFLLSSLLLLGVSSCQTPPSERVMSEGEVSSVEVRLSAVMVELADGEMLNGRYLTGVTAEEFTFEYNGESESFPVDAVEMVQFVQEDIPEGGGSPIIREGDETWIVQPVTGFQVEDSQKAIIEEDAFQIEPESSFSEYAVQELRVDGEGDDGTRLELTVIEQD